MYENLTIQIVIELVAIVLCIVLAAFMARPFKMLRDFRYLGLPFGFAFLGLSFLFAALFFIGIIYWLSFTSVFCWLADVFRPIAFILIASTYYFSRSISKKDKLLWNLTVSLMLLALTALTLFMYFNTHTLSGQVYLRITCIIFLAYISIHTLRSYIKELSFRAMLVPIGFILLLMSQYSFIFLSESRTAIWAGYGIRLAGLVVFLIIALRNFYGSKESTK